MTDGVISIRIGTASEMLTMSDVFRSSVVIHDSVNAIVGTAASMMPRTPPNALASCARTAASTVSWATSSASALT